MLTPFRPYVISAARLRELLFAPCLSVLFVACGCGKPPQAAPPPPTVEFVTLEQKDVPLYHKWVGTLSGDVNASISAQVSGYLISRNYNEGDTVTNGQVLFQIDASTYQTARASALAQLAQATAVKTKTKLDRERFSVLVQTDAVSKQEYDNAVQADQSAAAQVEVAQAQVAQAELNLGFTTIRSPIAGKAGLAKAQVGDLISPASGALTTVSKINPIRANFAVSEQLVYKSLQHDAASGGDAERSRFRLELLLAGGDLYPEPGHIRFTGNQVDFKTGTIEVVGEFPNPQGLLLPGMFARVRAMVRVQSGALLVPQRAVAEMQGHRLVAFIDADDKISIRPVTVGEMVGDQWIIAGSGLKAGDRIVAEGIQKVREGDIVQPVPFGKPAAKTP